MKRTIIAGALSLTMSLALCGFTAHAQTISTPIEGSTSTSSYVVDTPSKTSYSFEELYAIEYDENGNIVPTPKVPLSAHSIEAGHSMHYYGPIMNQFSITAGTDIDFEVNFDKSTKNPKADIGLCKDDKKEIKKKSISKSGTYRISNATTGYYTFYIKNTSADTIKISSGSIVFPV